MSTNRAAASQYEHVNLDEHPATLASGRVLDEAGAEDLAAELLAAADQPLPEHVRRPGRPSLGERGHSPAVHFRLPAGLREKATAEAQRRGVSVSALARTALEDLLAQPR